MKTYVLGIIGIVLICVGFSTSWTIALVIAAVLVAAYLLVSRLATAGDAKNAEMKKRLQDARNRMPDGTTKPSGDKAIVCPHCQTRGQVTSRRTRRSAGVDGAKLGRAMHGSPEGALGGMARKEEVTELSCGACSMTWVVA